MSKKKSTIVHSSLVLAVTEVSSGGDQVQGGMGALGVIDLPRGGEDFQSTVDPPVPLLIGDPLHHS